jgi:hypothetical protein
MAFTAFQRNAFQNNAFQIGTGDVGEAIIAHRSGTPFTKRRYRRSNGKLAQRELDDLIGRDKAA